MFRVATGRFRKDQQIATRQNTGFALLRNWSILFSISGLVAGLSGLVKRHDMFIIRE